MFSILILTKNEEINLSACLDSVAWCDDVVVLDSLSTDRTREIASASGARFFEREFDDFGSQRNHALDNIPFKYPWVFHLDADERFNEELRLDCEKAMLEDEHSAFFVPNRIIFLGRWIRRSTQYPYPQVRFLKIGEVRFAKAGHGQREDQVERSLGSIRSAYDHYNFSKGIGDWVAKHNHYSDEEAGLAMVDAGPMPWSHLFKGGIERKRAMKDLLTRLPFRWVFKFLYLYILRLGFIDGYPGFIYCVLQSYYDFLITIKIRERRWSTGHVGVKG